MKKSRVYAGLIAIGTAGALVLSGCAPQGGDKKSEGSKGDASAIITTSGSTPQNPLIPTNTNEVGGGKILDLLFAGLVYYDEKGATHNDVAESIEGNDDNTKFTIKIRKDAKFSDGTPVKAENFVKAWNYGADAANAQLSSYFFEDIKGYSSDTSKPELEGLKVVDDHTFTVELKQPTADWPLRMGYSAYFPLPDVAFKDMEAFGKKPIGNGLYTLESLTRDVSAKLVKSKTYVGPREAKNGGIEIRFYAKPEAAYADMQADKLDVLDAVPDANMATYEKEFKGRTVNQPSAVFQSFTVPERLEHFGGEEGKLRRQAMSMAIDRKTITEKIFHGGRTPAKDFTSPVIDGWKDDVPGSEVLEFNPKKAKQLWAKADKISPWGDTTFQLAYNGDASHQGWVDAVCNSLKKNLGINASGQPYPTFPKLREEVTNKTIKSGFRTGWQADYPGMYNFLGPLYGTGAGSNDGDYSNKEFDTLIKKGNESKDPEAASKEYLKAQEILLKDLPAIPLWYGTVNGVWSTKVDNVKFAWNSGPIYEEITKKKG